MYSQKKILLFAFLAILCGACSTGGANLTYEHAAQLVIDQVIQPDSLDHDLIAFGLPEALQPGDVLQPYNFLGKDPAPGQTAIEAETWFFWIDDAPGGRFAHSNRYVLIDRTSGALTVHDEQWWPEVNGEGLWIDNTSYFDSANWIYSTIDFPEATSGNPAFPKGLPGYARLLPSLRGIDEPTGFALIINASNKDERGHEDMRADASNMIGILGDAGFNTTYMGPDDDPNPDRSEAPFSDTTKTTQQPWRKWLTARAREMKPGETLVVYITGHGTYLDNRSAIGGKNGVIFDSNLKDALKQFNPGIHIVVITDACEAGGYIDALTDVADVTMTASNKTSGSTGDVDFALSFFNPLLLTDLNPFDEGGEYTSSLVEGWNNLLSDPNEVERVRQLAIDNGHGFWTNFFAEAYEDGSMYNLPARLLLSHPMTSFGSDKTKARVEVPGATNDVKSCTTGEVITDPVPARLDADHVSAEWIQQHGEYVLRFSSEFSGIEDFDLPVWGGIEIFDPSRPTSDDHEGYIYSGLGNIQFGFLAGKGVFTPRFNLVDPTNHWQTFSNAPYSGFVEGNVINIDVPGYLIPPDGTFYFYTDDGSRCDDVGLDASGQPFGLIPAGGPIFDFPRVNFDDPTDLLPQSLFDAPGGPIVCDSGEGVNDPGVDILQVDVYAPTNSHLMFDVLIGDPGPARLDNFSFAVIVDLFSDITQSTSYLIEHHDGESRFTQIDPGSGSPIASNTGFAFKESILDGRPTTRVGFEIPLVDLAPQIDGFNIYSYRTLNNGDPKHCDYQLGLFQPPFSTGEDSE